MTDAMTDATVDATRTAWLRGPIVDFLVAFAWVPVFVTATMVDDADLVRLTAAVLLLSFGHQPVTLPLLYGDARERRARTALLVLAPVVAVGAVYIGLVVSLGLVAVVAGLWNAHHTLRQRYGVVRIYGRKVGQTDGAYEQALLFSWFTVVACLALAGDGLVDRLRRLPIGVLNNQILDLLEVVAPVAAVGAIPAAVWAAWVTVRWVGLERDRPGNPAKHVYLGGVAISFVVALFDPVAGFLGFMSAHAIEYLVVVAGTVRSRSMPGSTLRRIVEVPGGPVVFLAGYVALVFVLVAIGQALVPARAFLAVYFAVGVLHFVFDGMIWRLRRPDVAAHFAIDSPGREPVG